MKTNKIFYRNEYQMIILGSRAPAALKSHNLNAIYEPIV
jgi:hypothetical protein